MKKTIDNKVVGERIRAIRLENGLTLQEFGERFNTSKATVFNWEKGRNLPNKANLRKLAFYGQVSVSRLLHGLDSNTNIMNEFIEFVGTDTSPMAKVAIKDGCRDRFITPQEYAITVAKLFIRNLEIDARRGKA